MHAYVSKALERLSGRDPVEILSTTPSRLEDAFWELGPRGLDRSYGEGKWTARQVFAHLADVEIVYAFRLRQALAENTPTVQVMDQDAWARAGRYEKVDPKRSLAAFRAAREANLDLARRLPKAALSRHGTHSQFGRLTISDTFTFLAGHRSSPNIESDDFLRVHQFSG